MFADLTQPNMRTTLIRYAAENRFLQSQMAELIGVSVPTYVSFVRGTLQSSADTVMKMQDFIEKNKIITPPLPTLNNHLEEDGALRDMGIVPHRKRDLTDSEKRIVVYALYSLYHSDTKRADEILDIILT